MQRSFTKSRVAIVVNPHTCAGSTAELWRAARERLGRDAIVVAELETRPDRSNASRVGRLVAECHPDVVVAAGGDGTVRDVAKGMMASTARTRTALAILPLGTANNVARSLGLSSCRRAGMAAIETALTTMLSRSARWIDVGSIGDDYFVGSFALGMDADILRMRNRYRARFPSSRLVRGYPLYLWSCGLNLLRPHGADARLTIDGDAMTMRAYNLLVTNTSIYAGEFRFDGVDRSDDGQLDLHLFGGPLDYVARYTAAWVRHLRHGRGLGSTEPNDLFRMRSLAVRLDAPLYAQIDGEPMAAIDECTIAVVPRALCVRVPSSATNAAVLQDALGSSTPDREKWASSGVR